MELTEAQKELVKSVVPNEYTDANGDIYTLSAISGYNEGIMTYVVSYTTTKSDGTSQTQIKSYTQTEINKKKTERTLKMLEGTIGNTYTTQNVEGNEYRTYTNPATGKVTSIVINADGTCSYLGTDEETKRAFEAANEAIKISTNGVNASEETYTNEVINIPDTETAAKMLDRITRINKDRRLQPLSRFEGLTYPHRTYYDKYNLQIGDTWFMVPPEFIMITSESQTGKIVTLRQENTQKTKAGYHRRTIMIDLVAHGADQINGFAVNGPEDKKYYVDGLRPLLAQFKRTPFLPIFNELINETYGVHTVALQSITIRTVPNFPTVMTAQLTLQEMNMMPYIETHSIQFQHMIDWDLMRFYYQQALTENHEYKKLQSVPLNKEENHLIVRSLNAEVLYDYSEKSDTDGSTFMDIITSKDNYDVWVDSSKHEFSLIEFSCNYSNMLANIQMSEADSPTVQFMGGMDTIYNIVIETKDKDMVSCFEQCRLNNDYLTRSNPRLRSLGFVMLEAELVEFTGSLFVMIDNVTTNTVPGFPGLFNIQVTCVAYDIGQSEREQLHGFLPFKGDAYDQTIEQNHTGVYKKISQDLYAEARIIEKMEVYPDLHLPTYGEVDSFITKCRTFRSKNKLSQLPYTKYPRNPYNMLHGCEDSKTIGKDLFHPSDYTFSTVTYDKFVDPDFYVFYPMPYVTLIEDIDEEAPKFASRAGFSGVIGTNYNTGGNYIAMDSDDILDFCAKIISENEGSYDSINKYDNNGPSIGKLQWHNSRGISLLKTIVSSNKQKSTEIIGEAAVNEILSYTETSWYKKALGKDVLKGDTTVANLKKLLGQDFAIKAQDDLIKTDVKGYIDFAYKLGLTDTSAIVYYADMRNQHGSPQWMTDAVKEALGNGGTLTALHEAVLKRDTCNGCANRRTKTYNKLLNTANAQFVSVPGFSKITDNDSNLVKYNMSQATYNQICNLITYITNGESGKQNTERAIAQSIFDRLTTLGDGASTLSAICSEYGWIQAEYDNLGLTHSDTVEQIVKDVFTDGVKELPNYCIYGIYDMDGNDADVGERIVKRCTREHDYNYVDVAYSNQGSMDVYGVKKKSPTNIAFVIEGDDIKAPDNSQYRKDIAAFDLTINGANTMNIQSNATTYGENSLKYFGEPIVVKNKRIIYDGKDNVKFVNEQVHNPINVYNSCFTNMYQYSCRGRLIRAFPTFLFCVLDDQAQWYDGRKLWTNYYVYQSIVDIQVHQANDMPTETATITITNSAHNLSKTQAGMSRYSIRSDPAYFNGFLGGINDWFYRNTGLVIGGIKITNKLIELHQKLYNHARLREGARIHLRMGYGSDPFSLAPMINGHISDISLGDQITMVVTSDGHEMIHTLASAKKKDVNNGFLGLFGFGSTQEASNIIAKMMVERSSWINHLWLGGMASKWFEGSKYGIEHFGIYFQYEGGFKGWAADRLHDLWDEAREHWDILMNIYIANYKNELYVVGSDGFAWLDGENNFSFNKYNMTPWDVTQVCTQQAPEYICKCIKHQFDSRLFYGLPRHMERYRYDFFGGTPTKATKKTSTTVGGDAANGDGKFTNTSYSSGNVPPNPPKDKDGNYLPMKSCNFKIKMHGHNLRADQEASTPDTLKIFATYQNSDGTTYEKELTGKSPMNYFSGDFLSSERTASANQKQLEGVIKLRFEAFCCHENCCKNNNDYIKWEIVYDETNLEEEETEENEYGDILYEELRAAGQAHYLDSMTCIIDNQVKVSNKYSNTNIKCMYILGNSGATTSVLHSDDTIDAAYQKTTIIDTPIVQDALGPDFLYQFLSYDIGRDSAERIGVSTLLYGWSQQYQGQILLFGSPGIKPFDYLMINDTFSDLHGLSTCREVIHSFNSSMGFTTSVTPGMIGFSTRTESGMITHCQNLLATLNYFSILTDTRLEHTHFIERYITELSREMTILAHACELLQASRDIYDAKNKVNGAVNLATFIGFSVQMIRTCRNVGGIIAYAGKIINAVAAGFKGVKAASGIIATVGALSKGILAIGPNAAKAALGAGPVGWAIAIGIFLIDKLINAVMNYLANKNVVVLMPMYWQNYPFVSGVKDGEKILLMDSNSTATDENDKSAGQANPYAPDDTFVEQED